MEKGRNYPETVFRLILLLLGGVVVVLSLKLGFGALAKPGPGLVPFLSGSLILISALILVLSREKAAGEKSSFNRREMKIHLSLMVVFVCWIMVMPVLGYVLVTFIATFLFSKIMELEGWVKPLFLSIGTTLLSYLLFDYFLYLDLPRGLLG